MSARLRHRHKSEAELDITSFMNLMIILVPVLLMSMVFSHTSVLELTLPALSDNSQSPEDLQNKQLELVVRADHIDVNYPAGTRVKRIEKSDDSHNMALLSITLQEIKRQLREAGVDKKDIMILSEPSTDYQTVISIMDSARSFQALVATSVVNAELFPEISLGDAPLSTAQAEGAKL